MTLLNTYTKPATLKQLASEVCDKLRYALWRTIPEQGWYCDGMIAFKLDDKTKAKLVQWCNKIENKNESETYPDFRKYLPDYCETVAAEVVGEAQYRDGLNYTQTGTALAGADGRRVILNTHRYATICKYQPTATIRIADTRAAWFVGRECVGVMTIIDRKEYV